MLQLILPYIYFYLMKDQGYWAWEGWCTQNK